MAIGEDIALLRSIDATLKELLALSKARASKPANGATVASDRELDDPKFGDPTIKFDPRDWTGPSQKGLNMSGADPEFLDMIAETFDYFATKAEETKELYNGKPVAPYKRKDAARARGWAARIRGGWKAPVMEETSEGDKW